MHALKIWIKSIIHARKQNFVPWTTVKKLDEWYKVFD